jgi:polyisoprenoid-binding protein YceI
MTTQSATKWVIDPMHSEVEFKVKHLMISTVTGKFNSFAAEVATPGEDFAHAQIHFTADTASINTGNDQRDGHLKSDDFFNAEQFPKMTFNSTAVTKNSDNEYKVTGDLTIRDITKSVTLDVEFNGTMTDPYGQHKAGFEVTGKINRKEFGLQWSATTEAGGIVVSDDVKIHANVQFVKQA